MPLKLVPFLVAAFILFPFARTSAEDRYSPSVRKTLSAAYALKERADIVSALSSGASKASLPSDKKAILSSLADYEERSGFASDAAARYNEAAFIDKSSRDDSLVLDSARCLLVSGDSDGADGLVRAVLLTCFDDTLLVRARVYSAWIQLSSGDSAPALSAIRSWTDNPVFASWAPSLLFTLWWVDGDGASRAKLLEKWPTSPEASILQGKMSLAPVPFWYLMGRNADSVASFARDGSAALALTAQDSSSAPDNSGPAVPTAAALTAAAPVQLASSPSVASVTPLVAGPPSGLSVPGTQKAWQQTGFFRNRENAEDLSGKLGALGFKPVIREEKRPSGTVYFSVLVPDDSGTAGAKLKDAGFESYLVTD